MIKASDISFSYGGEPVFDGAGFIVGKRQKVGLVGPNGSGKSTLFKLITGTENLSGGNIETHGVTGFVPQEVKRDPELENADSIRIFLDPHSEKPDFELKKLLAGLEAEEVELEAKPINLSGGQKTKLALARALLAQPDILLLDEPTNFMDRAGKHFVMEFLATYPNTVIVISHDLELLDKHIDKVLAVNVHTKKIDEYKGDYSQFIKLKKEREELLKRQILVKQKHIERMEKALSKMTRLTSTKGVRARVRQQKRIRREKATLPEMPRDIAAIKLNLPEPPRVGELPIRAHNISKSYNGNAVVENLSFSVRRGEKLLLIGPNGSGKSTVIKIITGTLKPDSGYIEPGANLKIGYYSQEFENFDLSERVLQMVQHKGKLDEQKARGYLARFMFDEDKVKQRIESLSGGEKTRLSIALVMLENNNLLVLDEPTTYLDPLSQRVILEALKEYKGTVILVSHVEDFVREIKPDRSLFMPEGRVLLWDNELLEKVGEV
jgi:ATP-binding cassette, subfamily F, member 3